MDAIEKYIFLDVDDNQIYHYTTKHGLLGILNDSALWASDMNYLNDEREFLYAIDLAGVVVKERIENEADEFILKLLNLLAKHTTTWKYLNVYVFSFSEKGDLLSQWRAYSADAEGFSICFNAETLDALCKVNRFNLGKVVYDKVHQKEVIHNLIDLVLNNSKETNCNLMTSEQYFMELLSTTLPFLKSKSFSEEKEWRLVSLWDIPSLVSERKDRYYRPSKSYLIPYVHFKFTDSVDVIQSVITGPSAHPHLSKHSLDLLLRDNGLKNAAYNSKNSTIAYRG